MSAATRHAPNRPGDERAEHAAAGDGGGGIAGDSIPVYGPPGLFGGPDGKGTHGLNERARVDAVYKGRDFLTERGRLYADAG